MAKGNGTKKKKGITLYALIWAFIGYVDVTFLFELFCGYTTVENIMASDNPERYIRNFHIFNLIYMVFLIVTLVIFGMALLKKVRVGFDLLTDLTKRLADGDVDIEVGETKADEFGALMDEYEILINATREQAVLAEAVAGGNMTVNIVPRTGTDKLGLALEEMVERNNHTLSNIKDSALQVTTSSSEVASASEALAQGSTEQASAIEEITASIADVADKTRQNATEATNAATLVEHAVSNVQRGNEQMNEMMAAMRDINDSSESISRIIKVIDDIAFQTNILALNAAVEAARAGEAGKGFAVVAEEVRNLAAKSAQAASETAELIEDSIRKVEAGSAIAEDTAKALEQITKAVTESGEIISGIADASNYQATAIAQINQAIEQVSQVVQNNSATSEECAAASIELSNQASRMRELISVFRLHSENSAAADFEAKASYAYAEPAGSNEPVISLGEGFGKY